MYLLQKWLSYQFLNSNISLMKSDFWRVMYSQKAFLTLDSGLSAADSRIERLLVTLKGDCYRRCITQWNRKGLHWEAFSQFLKNKKSERNVGFLIWTIRFRALNLADQIGMIQPSSLLGFGESKYSIAQSRFRFPSGIYTLFWINPATTPPFTCIYQWLR